MSRVYQIPTWSGFPHKTFSICRSELPELPALQNGAKSLVHKVGPSGEMVHS